jgi:hypothetical protein
MPILIKCNASDLISGDEQTFTLKWTPSVGPLVPVC